MYKYCSSQLNSGICTSCQCLCAVYLNDDSVLNEFWTEINMTNYIWAFIHAMRYVTLSEVQHLLNTNYCWATPWAMLACMSMCEMMTNGMYEFAVDIYFNNEHAGESIWQLIQNRK